MRGGGTLKVEVTNISAHGIWVLAGEREFFLSFEAFPWFIDVPVRHVLNVGSPHPTYLRWPDLDVDLALESIEHPERFPLVSRVQSARRPRTPRTRNTAARTGRSSHTRR